MKNLRKRIIGICVLLMITVGILPAMVFAADMNLTVATSDNAKAGDTVKVRLVIGDNPGISTFAVRVSYDDEYLAYTGAEWSDTVTSDSANVQLISEVQEDGNPTLSVSAILNKEYASNETIVTLSFSVKKEYTTMPVTASVREVNDSNFEAVTVNMVVDANAGEDSGSSESTQDNGQSSSTDSNQKETQVSSQSESTTSVTKESDKTGNTTVKVKEEKEKKQIDQTPKTGAVDMRLVFVVLIVVFVVIAGICIKVLGKKKRV